MLHEQYTEFRRLILLKVIFLFKVIKVPFLLRIKNQHPICNAWTTKSFPVQDNAICRAIDTNKDLKEQTSSLDNQETYQIHIIDSCLPFSWATCSWSGRQSKIRKEKLVHKVQMINFFNWTNSINQHVSNVWTFWSEL